MFQRIFIFLFLIALTSVVSAANYYVNTATLKVRSAPTTKSAHSYSVYKKQKVRVYEIQNGWARISRYKTSTSNGKFTKSAKWVFAKFITKIDSKPVKKVKSTKQIKKKTVPKKVVKEKVSKPVSSICKECKYKRKDRKKAQLERSKKAQLRREKEALIKENEALRKENEELRKKSGIKKEVPKEKFVMPKKDSKLYQVISKSDHFKENEYVFFLAAQKLIEHGVCKIDDFKRMRGWVETSPENTYFTYCGGFKRKNKIYVNVKTGVLHR